MIDYEKMIITGRSGKIYKISPETISAARYTEYSIKSSLLAFNTDFETLFKRIGLSINHLRNGKENAQGNAANAINELEGIIKGMLNYHENKRPIIVEFCSTFCIAEGEDVTKHTEDIIREKYEDWNHISMYDFFLLPSKVIPKFKEHLKSILESHQPKPENII